MSFDLAYPSSLEPLPPVEEPPAPPRKRASRKKAAPVEATAEGQDSLPAASASSASDKPPARARKRAPKKSPPVEHLPVEPELPVPPANEFSDPVAPFNPDGVLSLPTLFSEPAPMLPSPGELTAEVLAQKRRHKPSTPAGSEFGVDPDEDIIVLSSLLHSLLERKQNGGSSAPEGETRARINRFVPRANGGASTAEHPAPISETSLLNLPPAANFSAPGVDSAEGPAPAPFPKFEPRSYEPAPTDWPRNGSAWGRGVLYFGFAAALALAAFLVGRTDPRPLPVHRAPGTADEMSPVRWMPVFSNQLDKAHAADRAGDLSTAARLMDELAQSMKPNPVLQAYQASIDTRRGLSNEVEATLSRLLRLTPGLDANARLNEAQGFNYARRRDFDLAIDAFRAVAEVEPFNTTNLLHLGEALRRKGRLAEAADTFRLALARLPDNPSPSMQAQREYLAYERRLSEVENGLGEQLKAALDQHLNAPAPSADWWLTSAALALEKGDVPTATAALKKAQSTLPPEQFSTLMDDYLFRSFSYHPELKTFLNSRTPEQQKARQEKTEFYLDP